MDLSTSYGPLNFVVHVMSGQGRSECLMCTFQASCCSTHLSWAQVPAFAGSSVWEGGSKGVGEPPALAGTREYEQSNQVR